MTIISPTNSFAPWGTIKTFLNHYKILTTLQLTSSPILAFYGKYFPNYASKIIHFISTWSINFHKKPTKNKECNIFQIKIQPF